MSTPDQRQERKDTKRANNILGMSNDEHLKPIKPLTWRERLHSKISYWLFRQFQVKQGPMMFHIRGEWWFVDHYGNIWIIRYSAHYDYPFDIVLFHRP